MSAAGAAAEHQAAAQAAAEALADSQAAAAQAAASCECLDPAARLAFLAAMAEANCRHASAKPFLLLVASCCCVNSRC